MKKIASLIICAALLCALLCIDVFAGESTEFVSKESAWQYLEYENAGAEAPEGWATGEDEGNEWFEGTAPLGNSVNGSVYTPMSWDNFSCFMRTTFEVDNKDDLVGFGMNIIYDENPIVYINGEEVWSASGYKDNGYTFVSLEDYTDIIVEGENYIAVYFENSFGGAILDLDLVKRSTQNDDGTFLAKSAESFDGEGNPKSNPWGAIGDVSNMFDINGTSIWGFPYVENMNVVVEYYDTFVIESITVTCKDEGPVPADESHGTYKIEALVDGEWVVVAEEVHAYAYDMYMSESTVTPEETIETNTIKVTITSWHADLIETYWGGIAELEVRGESTTVVPEPTPDEDVTPTPDSDPTVEPTVKPTVEPTTEPTVEPTAEPDKTPEGTSTTIGSTPTPDNTDEDPSNTVTIIIIISAIVVVASVVVIIVLRKKK